MAKIIDLARTAYFYVPGADGIANVHAPGLDELSATGVKNISPLVVNSSSIGAKPSDTTDERAVTASGNAKTPTIGNYDGQLNLFRDGDEATGTFSTDDVLTLIPRKGIEHFIVKRTGLPWNAPLAVGQTVEVYAFVTDTPIPTGGATDGFLKLMVTLLPTGDFDVAAKIVAVADDGEAA